MRLTQRRRHQSNPYTRPRATWDRRTDSPRWQILLGLLLVGILLFGTAMAETPPLYLMRDVTYADVQASEYYVPATWGEVLAYLAVAPQAHTGVVVEIFNTEHGGGTERTFDADGNQTSYRTVEPTVRTNYWMAPVRWVQSLDIDSVFGSPRRSCRR